MSKPPDHRMIPLVVLYHVPRGEVFKAEDAFIKQGKIIFWDRTFGRLVLAEKTFPTDTVVFFTDESGIKSAKDIYLELQQSNFTDADREMIAIAFSDFLVPTQPDYSPYRPPIRKTSSGRFDPSQ